MNIMSLIFVRYNSQRLPGKALMDIGGHPAIFWLCRQMRHSQIPFVVCTSNNPMDDAIVEFCKQNSVMFFRGSESNVLERMSGAIQRFDLTHAIRVTGDDLFVDPRYLDRTVQEYNGASFCFTDLPKGTDFQIVSAEYINQLTKQNKREDTEYLTWYFNNATDKQFVRVSPVGLETYSFELDTREDVDRVKMIVQEFSSRPYFDLESLLDFASQHSGCFEVKSVVNDRSEKL